MQQELTEKAEKPPKPLQPDELKEMATFSDGSGKHWQNMAWAGDALRKHERGIELLRAFIAKYEVLLAGASWSVEISPEPEINLGGSYRYYRGQQVDVKFLARLFPTADWRRVKRKYASTLEDDGIRDWVALVDGVLLRIERAENYAAPKPTFPKEGRVRL
jgi:hypothetical protein